MLRESLLRYCNGRASRHGPTRVTIASMSSLVEPVALAVWRERKHKSRDELALAAGVTERAIRAWEYGARRMGADDVGRCARALGLLDAEELSLHRWAATICPPPEGKRPAAGEGA